MMKINYSSEVITLEGKLTLVVTITKEEHDRLVDAYIKDFGRLRELRIDDN